MVQDILKFLVYDLLGTSSILVGFIAMVGLLLQKKSGDKVLTGTIKTIVGFLIFSAGAGVGVQALSGFQELFTKGFNLTGVLPFNRCYYLRIFSSYFPSYRSKRNEKNYWT